MGFLFVEVGLVEALFGSALDLLCGSADFSGEAVELGLLGVSGSEVLGRGEAFDVVGDEIVCDGEGESHLEQVERFEQQIVGGCGGDAGPVGLDEFEVGADGGDGDLDGLGDLLERLSMLAEVVDSAGASASLGGDAHGMAFR